MLQSICKCLQMATFEDKLRHLSHNKHIKYGFPFLTLMVAGYFWVREFASVRYEFRKTEALDPAELGVPMKETKTTLESEYEKIKDLKFDDWEQKRGPRLWDESKERMEIICKVQTYDWGKKGNDSKVAQLAQANSKEPIQENQPYAELWMGVHPSGPSFIKSTNQPLSEYLKDNPNKLGEKVSDAFEGQLPFLFKVLSVAKALSIQAHPSKEHAEQLFKTSPNLYKDPNHKPELAIALTTFEALCGFRPVREIYKFIEETPELEKLIGAEIIGQLRQGEIKQSFQKLMTCSADDAKQAIESYLFRVKDTSLERNLVERLNQQYPGDVGVLCVFWLNIVTLKPGEALFLGPNEPHAYLSGDCVECMANSDNVVRAGLTPKFRDVETLCSMLTYKSYKPSEIKFSPVVETPNTLLYKPPVKDFAVASTKICGGETVVLKILNGASILLCVNGESHATSSFGKVNMSLGTILFIPAGEAVTIDCKSEQILYRAFCGL